MSSSESVGSSVLSNAVISTGGGGLVGAKREAFEARARQYDTVVLGSSHVFHSFVPSEFDRLLGEAGRELDRLGHEHPTGDGCRIDGAQHRLGDLVDARLAPVAEEDQGQVTVVEGVGLVGDLLLG